MEISLTYELYVFLSAVLLGVVEGVIFDFFKAFRKRASKSISTVDVLDIIYWFFNRIVSEHLTTEFSKE